MTIKTFSLSFFFHCHCHFISDLENSLEQIKDDHTSIIAGDLNIDIIQFHVGDVLEYITTLMSAKYLPYIVLPTRITHHSTTCIDHIFVRNNPRHGYQDILGGVFYCEITDHLPNFVTLKSDDAISSTDRPMVRLFGENNGQKFIQSMLSINWNELYSDREDWYQLFIHRLKQIFEQSFPWVRLSRKRMKDKPWITSGLKKSIKKKNCLYKIMIQNRTTYNAEKYTRYKNILTSCLKTAELDYYSAIFENSRSSTFNLWKILGPVINPKKVHKQTMINKLLLNGKAVTDNGDIAEVMNQCFCEIGSKLKSKIPSKGNDYIKYLPPAVVNSFFLTPLCEEDVTREIKKYESKKSHGTWWNQHKDIAIMPWYICI